VVRTVRNDAGDQDFVGGQRRVLPDLPLPVVARIGGFDRVAAGVDVQHDIDELRQGQVVGVGTLATAPAHVDDDAVLGNAAQGVVQCIDAHLRVLAKFLDR